MAVNFAIACSGTFTYIHIYIQIYIQFIKCPIIIVQLAAATSSYVNNYMPVFWVSIVVIAMILSLGWSLVLQQRWSSNRGKFMQQVHLACGFP